MNALAPNGDTPLHLALKLSDENRCLMLAKLLVEVGCSPLEGDADDKPPVHIAVVRGFISVVEYLLSQHVPLPSRILFAALQTTLPKRIEMIRLLIDKGANVHTLRPNGDALLHVAMRSLDRSVCPEIAKIFIDAGCNPSASNQNGETPLCIAAKQEYREIGNYLLLFGVPSDVWDLLHPCPSYQARALRSLIGNAGGLHFLPEEEERLFQVIRNFLDDEDKFLSMTKWVVAASAGAPKNDTHIFDSAVRRGFHLVIEYLLSQYMSLPDTILFTALRHQVSMISFLIRKGADVHAYDYMGSTLLHVALSFPEEARCLIAVRALFDASHQSSIPNDPNNARQLPIEVAVSRGFVSVVGYLLSQHMPLPHGILFTAIRHQVALVPFLIRQGADVHAREKNGDTLLQVAITTLEEAQCLSTMKDLFRAGFHVPMADQLPIKVAISRGFVSIVEYLLSQRMSLPLGILFTALRLRLSMVPFLIRKGVSLHAKEMIEIFTCMFLHLVLFHYLNPDLSYLGIFICCTVLLVR